MFSSNLIKDNDISNVTTRFVTILIFDYRSKKKKTIDQTGNVPSTISCVRAYYNILLDLLRRYSLRMFHEKSLRRGILSSPMWTRLRRCSSNQRHLRFPLSSSLGISNSILGCSKNRFILRNNVVRTK